ncbi:hypothetical protein [Actinomadura rupiterrae]|uniref:hypothetical protein n=1 Tax=Actinomadura rupiterrae TaxID=559627 RepID=UPI0020A2C369|nr:hypothetical protein [Actinomadura rupiterrae]MCP2338297.1 hypothetical protein [Actinomadura rupiterrae]
MRQSAPPRTPFVLLIVGLLGGALASLLLLNTVLAEDAFTLSRLQQNNKLLDQQRQQMQSDIAREEAPASLDAKARGYGMRPPTQPAWISPDGTVTGTRGVRPVPNAAAATAGAAGVLGVPGAIIPGEGVPSAPGAGDGGQGAP